MGRTDGWTIRDTSRNDCLDRSCGSCSACGACMAPEERLEELLCMLEICRDTDAARDLQELCDNIALPPRTP